MHIPLLYPLFYVVRVGLIAITDDDDALASSSSAANFSNEQLKSLDVCPSRMMHGNQNNSSSAAELTPPPCLNVLQVFFLGHAN